MSDYTAENITKALGGRWRGHEGTARCPAHDDRTPSLSIADGQKGVPVVHCHAGCDQRAVIEALRKKGLWAERAECAAIGEPRIRRRQPVRRGFVPRASALPPDLSLMFRSSIAASWAYHDSVGNAVFYIVRINKPDGSKIIFPVSYDGKQWVKKAYPPPRPLYNLPGLAAEPHKPVLIVEGEKTADAAQHLVNSHVIVTWAGGSNAIKQTSFTPLLLKDVVLWPDNDEAGRRAMAAVANEIYPIVKTMRMVELPDGLADGWDLADEMPETLDPCEIIARAKVFDG